MKWILILFIVAGNGVATTTAEFDSKSACKYAQKQWIDKSGTRLNMGAMCVEKGIDGQN